MENFIKENKIYFRDILLSTGEVIKEVVIIHEGKEYYDAASSGLTLGLKERQDETCYKEDIDPYILYKISSIVGDVSQKEFDLYIANLLPAQLVVALSLVYARFLAQKAGINHQYNFYKQFQTLGSNTKNIRIISNIINGGLHVGDKESFCEFMIMPKTFKVSESIKIASQVYVDLGQILIENIDKYRLCIGREGGYVKQGISSLDAIKFIEVAINKRNKGKCDIAIDVAANNFTKVTDGTFVYTVDGINYSSDELAKLYQKITTEHTLVKYIEDPFHEDDTRAWSSLMNLVGDDVMIVSDDLAISNISFLKQHAGLFNSSILKVNQAGTVSALIDSYKYCIDNNIKTIVSQRSGETDSNSIVHIAVGLGADFVKIGAPARERIVKYNELVRIYDRLKY